MDAETLTAAERRFLDTMLRRVADGGAMIAGTFCEALVAEALPGCTQPTFGTHPWDLDWEGIKVEVKMTRTPSWQVPARPHGSEGAQARPADVYVLATHEGRDHRAGWSFWVVPTSWLNDRARKSVSVRAVRAAFPSVEAEDLPGVIRAATATSDP